MTKEDALYREACKLFFETWQYRDAEQRSLELLELAQRSQDTYCQALALNIAGLSQRELGDIQASLNSFKHMLALPQDPQREKTVQRLAYSGIANAHHSLGQYEAVMEYAKKHLDIAQRLDDKAGQGAAYCNLGGAHHGLGQYEMAMEYAKKYLDIAQQLDDKAGQGAAYANLGCACEVMGQHERTIEYANKHLNIAQQLDDKAGQGEAYAKLGTAHDGLGRYEAAIEYAKKHLDIAQRLDDKAGQGAAHAKLGSAHHSLGQFGAVIENLKKYLDISRQLGDKPGQAAVYSSLGIAYRSTGQYQTAIECHQKNLEISIELDDKPGQGRAYGNIGNAHKSLGQFQAAIKNLKKYLEIAQQLQHMAGQGAAYGNLASVFGRLGQHKLAIEYSQNCLNITQELGDSIGERLAHSNLGLFYAQSGQFGLACPHFARSDALLHQTEAQLTEGQWRRHVLTFGEAHTRFMHEWVVAAARSGDMMEALRVEEQRRCRPELVYQAGLVRNRREENPTDSDVSVDGLKAMATRADASFVVVLKMYRGTLLTWVLSGQTGELVYGKVTDIAGRERERAECIRRATFAEWDEWQRTLGEACRWIAMHEEEIGQPIDETDLREAAEFLIPDDMKGDLDDKIWASMRDPRAFRETVCGQSGCFNELQSLFLQRAESAIGELSKLLWEPIMRECQAVKASLEGDVRRSKPVRVCSIKA